MYKSILKVGDIVRGVSDGYGITNRGMTKGEVMSVSANFNTCSIKVLEHLTNKGKIGHEYNALHMKDFEVIHSLDVEEVKQNKKEDENTIKCDKDTINYVNDTEATYIIINNKITIAIPKDIAVGISSNKEDLETNKAIAYFKMIKEGK